MVALSVLAGGLAGAMIAAPAAGAQGTWQGPINVSSQYNMNTEAQGFVGMSCPASNLCFGLDSAGYLTTYDGTAWTTPATVVPGNEEELAEVSCASPKFCVAGTSSAGGTYAGNVFS